MRCCRAWRFAEAAAGGSLTELFAAPARASWLEIGFGGGEHLVWQARANPDVGLIGCEVFEDGVVKVAVGDRRGRARQRSALAPRTRARSCGGCLTASLDRVFILFPDPWPKKRHVKRRLINRALVDQLARVMRPRRRAAHRHRYRRLSAHHPARHARASGVRLAGARASRIGGCGRPTGRRPAMKPRPGARGAAATFYALCGASALERPAAP